VVGALVLSHWFLDAPMHRPDLPLWPGSSVLVGAGLWNSPVATVALELGILAAGVALYVSATRKRDRFGRIGLSIMLTMLVLFFFGATAGPPPPSPQALATGVLAMWLLVPLAWWIDNHREAVP